MPAPIFTQEDMGAIQVSGANAGVYVPFMPTRILRAYAIVTTTLTVADAILTLSIQQADGTATTPTGASAGGTMTLPFATATVNTVYYKNLDETSGDLIVYPGERFHVLSNAGPTVGTCRLGLIVQTLGLADVDIRNHVASHPGSTDLPTALLGAVKLTA